MLLCCLLSWCDAPKLACWQFSYHSPVKCWHTLSDAGKCWQIWILRRMANAKADADRLCAASRCWQRSADRTPWEFVPYQLLTHYAITPSLCVGFFTLGVCWLYRYRTHSRVGLPLMLPYQQPSGVGNRIFCSSPIGQTLWWNSVCTRGSCQQQMFIFSNLRISEQSTFPLNSQTIRNAFLSNAISIFYYGIVFFKDQTLSPMYIYMCNLSKQDVYNWPQILLIIKYPCTRGMTDSQFISSKGSQTQTERSDPPEVRMQSSIKIWLFDGTAITWSYLSWSKCWWWIWHQSKQQRIDQTSGQREGVRCGGWKCADQWSRYLLPGTKAWAKYGICPNPNIWEYNQKCASVEKDSHNDKNNGHKFEKMDGSYNYSKVNPKPNDKNTSVDCKKFDLTDWAIQRIETESH